MKWIQTMIILTLWTAVAFYSIVHELFFVAVVNIVLQIYLFWYYVIRKPKTKCIVCNKWKDFDSKKNWCCSDICAHNYRR